MPRIYVSKIELLDARYPGLRQRVDAMFDAFATISAVTAMIQAAYGEHCHYTTVMKYRKRQWCKRRHTDLAAKASVTALQEFVAGRSN